MATLWVIGDSTLSSFEDKYFYPRYGYGTMMDKFLDDSFEVCNIALSGRSSKSYLIEPEYDILIKGMKQGDFLLIGFGHNDEKTEASRHTAGKGRYTDKGSFANSLYENYYLKAKECGCTTILCTPIVRRTPNNIWTDDMLHITLDQEKFVGGNYSEAIIEMGKDLDIPVVNMTALTKELYDSMGCDNTINFHAWPSNKAASVDNTHTNIWGARINAYMCLMEIKKLNIHGISEHVIHEEEDVFCKEKYLISDPNYKPVVYNSNLPDSRLWKEYNGFKGTVFGDIMPDESFKDFTLEPIENGVHIAVRNNSGKVSLVTDGIAMYYKKIPVGQDFTFSANLTINDYFKNNQVSFGLMVRDDCYVDMITPEGLGDFVAAAPYLLTMDNNYVNCIARKSGVITHGGIAKNPLKIGETYKVIIKSSNDGYSCQFGDEEAITGGFDFKLTSIDPENVYVGMFVSRNADITFTDIEIVMK